MKACKRYFYSKKQLNMGEMVFSKVIPRLDKRFEKEDHIHDVNNVNKGVMYVGALTTNLKNQNKTPQNHI
jgi:hypothetical protein